MKRAHEGKSQNPLFVKLLNEIKLDVAGSIRAYNIEKAINSLEKCPRKLKAAEDCLNLKFFGKKTCQMLKKKMKVYEMPNNVSSSDDESLDDEDENVGGKRAKMSSSDKEAKSKSYIPAEIDSSAYIILNIMYKHKQRSTNQGHMTKRDIMSEAQKYIDYQINKNDIEDFAVWPAMSTLIDENYVTKISSSHFCITDRGVNIVASSKIFENPPNPLFIKWLTEMEETAAAKKSTKQLTNIKKLLTAFQKCPIKLESATDCMEFDSMFNDDDATNLEWAEEIFNKLDEKLEQYEETDNSDEDTSMEEEQEKKSDKVPNQTGRKTKARGAKK